MQAITEAMALSRDAIAQGMYIEQFADKRVFAIGLEPPPMMWIFEWDILTGDSAVLDVLYAIVRDSAAGGPGGVDAAIAGGAQAVADVEQMRDLVTATDAATWRSPEMRDAFVDTLDYELDTLRLLQAYRAMILHQGEWHDTLSPDAYAQWDADRADYETLAAAHLERYEGDIDYPAFNLTAAQLGVERAERDLTMAWLARGLLLLALAWVVIGMLAARTRLVARPGAAAARATWIASTRPWRARESTLGLLELDRWLLLIVPAALLVATRAVQTSFLSWTHVAVTIGAWVVFALVVRLFVWRRSPWPVIAAVGGVVMLRCILTLFALSFTGPGGYWFAFWTDPVLRTAYITVAFALFVWVFVAAGWALAAQVRARRATGYVLAAVGAGLLIPSIVVGLVGLEAALTLWNDEMGLLPWGLARILGITTYLEIPDATPWAAAAFGAVLLVVGTALALPWRRRTSGARTPPPEARRSPGGVVGPHGSKGYFRKDPPNRFEEVISHALTKHITPVHRCRLRPAPRGLRVDRRVRAHRDVGRVVEVVESSVSEPAAVGERVGADGAQLEVWSGIVPDETAAGALGDAEAGTQWVTANVAQWVTDEDLTGADVAPVLRSTADDSFSAEAVSQQSVDVVMAPGKSYSYVWSFQVPDALVDAETLVVCVGEGDEGCSSLVAE